jgi:flagellar hook assembly protein FlgD
VERGRIVRRKKVVADGLPEVASLLGAYPNPFNPSTMISYALSSAGVVHLEVYDVLGQRVRLLSAGYRDAGRHQVVWDGRDEEGMSVSTGMYLVRLNAGDYRSVEKISLLR